ncbi:MAG: protein kinase [Alphaproteobacteria bacterium]|nr:protein kinase [Alphaproteobacteria bacterium]
MQLDDIKASVRPSMREQIDALYAKFQAEAGSSDLDEFVSWLHQGGHISAQTFRGLHAGGKLVLTSFETLAESTFYPDENTQKNLERELEEYDHDADDEPTDEAPTPRYQFLGKLAAGAMGEIHIVRERELQRKVALKRMHASIARKPKLARRFLNEAQITAQLDHPNIVPVYSLDSDGSDKPLSYTMKLIRGRTFAALIGETQTLYDERKPIDEDHALLTRLDCFCRACDALSYAHSRGVVHRDLKPENIMVGEYGEVYVMDWGIARIMESTEEIDDELVDVGGTSIHKTKFGAVLGTPAYMSPEQAAGLNEKLDGRSDGFSLGLILFELVCLRPAVSGNDTMQILDRMQEARIDGIQHYSRRESVPPALAAIIRKATARKPESRYQTVKELSEDVRRFLRGEPVSALREGMLQRLYRWISLHRELVLTAVLVGFFIFGTISIGSLVSALTTVRTASVREGQLSKLLSNVSRQGHQIDTQFHSYQALLKVVTTNTVESLSRGPDTLGDAYGGFYVKDDPPLGVPPDMYGRFVARFNPRDLGPAPVYGKGVELSLDYPNTHIARGEPPEKTTLVASQLALLRRPLRRVLIESHGAGVVTKDPEVAERLLRTQISPVQWVYVGLESGVGVTYPGHDGVTPGVDVRREPWYEAASGKYTAVWGNPHLDAGGVHTLLPVSMGIYTDEGEFVGVAALEVSFEYISKNLLSMSEFDGVADAFVLDEDGKVLMSTREEAERSSSSALRTRWLRRKRFENEEVREAVQERVGGYMEVEAEDGGTDLVVWSRMGDMGWTYLVQGPRHVLMD